MLELMIEEALRRPKDNIEDSFVKTRISIDVANIQRNRLHSQRTSPIAQPTNSASADRSVGSRCVREAKCLFLYGVSQEKSSS